MATYTQEEDAAPSTLAQLVARSRRLGADRSICNWGGGNTSAKSEETDFRGRRARVLWVKGSGSDLAAVTEASFTGLYLDDILPLIERERVSDTEMVEFLAHCFFEPGRPRPSIETLLHAFLPFTHVDHTHADATNFFACAAAGERLARECFGDALVWMPYRRPGFGLAREVAVAVRAHPQARLVILSKHGLITWGETDEACYASTLETIAKARAFVEQRLGAPAFGGTGVRATPVKNGGTANGSESAATVVPASQFPQAPTPEGGRVEVVPDETRREIAAGVLPVLRGLVSSEKRVVLRFEDAPDVLEFASSKDAPRLVQIGAACPDHLVHTKSWPLLVDWTP